MILAQLQAAHDSLPPWSAYAVFTGALCGFLLGAITMGVFALRLHRLHRFEERRAGSGRDTLIRSLGEAGAEKFQPRGAIISPPRAGIVEFLRVHRLGRGER